MSQTHSIALDHWVLETAPKAVAYARSLLRDVHAAEDVVQDCYCRLLAKKDVYDLPNDGWKILLRSITNACINRKARQKPLFRLTRVDENHEEVLDDPADTEARPAEEYVVVQELSIAVGVALQKLPPQQRAAVQLKSLGHTQQDIAEILEVTVNHAGVLLYRGRQALAELLAPFLDGEVIS